MQGVMSSIFLRQYIHYTKVLTGPAFWQGMWGAVQFKNIHEMEAMHLCLKSSICRKKKSELSRRKMLGNYSNAISVCVSVFTTVESTHLILIC